MIGVIDYGMGNLRSVFNAIDSLAIDATLVATPDGVAACDRLIVPGVGAFGRAMEELDRRGLSDAIREHARAGKPVLGICLGMQVLASEGREPVPTPGLGLVDGVAERLSVNPPRRLPHVGWNSLSLTRPHPVFEGVKPNADYYFVHSYVVQPANTSDALAHTEYEARFVSALAHENVVGVQFHPEKSQSNGLRILENFASWNGEC